jgi:twitching motility protein PilT
MTEKELSLNQLLAETIACGGSDLHLVHGSAPVVRVSGEIAALKYPALTSDQIMGMLRPFLEEHEIVSFKKQYRLHFSRTIESLGRFRFSMHQSIGTVGATIRVITRKIYSLATLGLPPIVGTLLSRRAGLILVTGPTGSGKSTTMAAMLEQLNQSGRHGKIITIEDPIETIFKAANCIFVQREVEVDTPSFETGILDALRQDPDILCIGELRDSKSIQAALLAAETGHLVITTLHTHDAAKTAQRIISSFPEAAQQALSDQFASTLEAVISQELLPRADGKGMVIAPEILIATPAIRQMIRERRFEAITDAIHAGGNIGMVSKDVWIKNLLQKNIITKETAMASIHNPQILEDKAPSTTQAAKENIFFRKL